MAHAATPQPTHDLPSLPSSPNPKRTKYTEPASNLSVASILNDSQPTPTPETATQPNPMENNLPMKPSATIPVALSSLALQVKLLSSTAKPPSRSSAFAAGYDLYASKPATVPAWGKVMVDTDISIAVPPETYGRVAPRSGLASKHSIHTGAGVIDADYRGPVKVLLFNLSAVDFNVEAGDRVAQLIIERIYTPGVAVVDELDETVRGAGGFGSTGGFGGTLPSINGNGTLPSISGADKI